MHGPVKLSVQSQSEEDQTCCPNARHKVEAQTGAVTHSISDESDTPIHVRIQYWAHCMYSPAVWISHILQYNLAIVAPL